jgi:hypothetical protein
MLAGFLLGIGVAYSALTYWHNRASAAEVFLAKTFGERLFMFFFFLLSPVSIPLGYLILFIAG